MKVILCNFLVRMLQYFKKNFFAHENMKKPSSKVAHNSYLDIFLTALSYPYGRKLKIHIGIWSEAPYVLSTLWMWYKFPQYIYGYINFSYMYLYM